MDESEKQARDSSSDSGLPKPPSAPSESPAAQASQSRRSEDNGFIEGDGSLTDFRNVVRWLTGRLTEDGQRQMRREWSAKYEKEYVARCEKQRDYLLKYSTTPLTSCSFSYSPFRLFFSIEKGRCFSCARAGFLHASLDNHNSEMEFRFFF